MSGDVVVIGGGNVAIDCARTAHRKGADNVSMYCLESRDTMPASLEEIEEAEEENVKINPGWGPKEILTDESGKVTGVKARNNLDGTEYTINAKAVVLATGGFLGSGEMTEKYLSDEYFPLKGKWNCYGSQGNDGAMLQSAIDKGAATYNIGMPPEVHMSGSAQVIPPSAGFPINEVEGMKGSYTGVQLVWSVADLPTYLGISTNSLAVAQNGKRFASETGIAMLDPWIAGPNYYSIWSTEQLKEIQEKGFKYNMGGVAAGFLGYCGAIPDNTPIPETFDVLDKAIEMGFVFKADSIEELAEQIGIDPAALAETVEQYNGFSLAGVDEEFGKDASLLEKIGEGPYYAVKMASYSYNTVAGLDINVDFQVLDAHGEVMDGLYAVGSDSAGVLFSEKKPYVTYGGANNGWALTSGYVAGAVVADYVK
jgi:fumarate reductase flavoprotein subunit